MLICISRSFKELYAGLAINACRVKKLAALYELACVHFTESLDDHKPD